MAITPEVAAVAGSALDLAGQTISNVRNMQLAKYQYKKNLEMWHLQNQYNSPQAQMERLKQAGLNPNLVYGTGAVGNNAGAAPEFKAPDFKLDAGGAAQRAQQAIQIGSILKYQDAQTKNVQADTLNKQTDNANKIVTNEILRKQAQKLGIDIDKLLAVNPMLVDKLKQDISEQALDINIKSGLAPYNLEVMRNKAKASEFMGESARLGIEKERENIKYIRKQAEGVQSQNDLREQETIFKKLENQWLKDGVTTKDALPVRMFQQWLKEKGIKPEDKNFGPNLLQKFFDTIDFIDPEVYEQYKKKAGR